MTDAVLKPVSDEALRAVALSRDDYDLACSQLGREPSPVELGIIGALWSEHCGYRTSKPLLKQLPTQGAHVLQGPGENAGAIDVGHGMACVFKVESHNHPSAVEPYQGAATGVGGIVRDIFAMGARPIALLDSLRFGDFSDPRQQHLLNGVVAGIGGYGNCIGIPTVGGEVYFDDAYSHNCLVNVMCVGIVPAAKLMRARATVPGSVVLLVGADTGRDGIHGATFASAQLDNSGPDSRPAVQVGNPFLEKCLMEATLELNGHPSVLAVQDLGAAGLTSAAGELAHRGDCGIDIDVARVSRRETGMSAYEVMLSESQERMLVVVPPGDEPVVQRVFERWELHSDVIGSITAGGHMVVRDGEQIVCDLPLNLLIDDVPLRTPEATLSSVPADLHVLPVATTLSNSQALLRLLASPNIGSRHSIWQRYDHQVGNDTVIGPGSDAALIRLHGTESALALSLDGNGRYGAVDARTGAAIAVCEAVRNVVATGATPLAATNCLNFGNPEKPEVYRQLSEAVAGMADACRELDVPIVSGNVSLYNETDGAGIDPTVVVGVVGKLDSLTKRLRSAFTPGCEIALVGPLLCDDLGGSEYQRITEHANGGALPPFNLAVERASSVFVLAANDAGLLTSAHDCAEGGLAVALAESALWGGCGIDVSLPLESLDFVRTATLFAEAQSRFVVGFDAAHTQRLSALAAEVGVAFTPLGQASGDAIRIDDIDIACDDALRAYRGALDG